MSNCEFFVSMFFVRAGNGDTDVFEDLDHPEDEEELEEQVSGGFHHQWEKWMDLARCLEALCLC